MADNKKKKKTGIGLAAWLLVAIILLIVFIVKWETIHNNLVRAGLIQGEIIEKPNKSEKTSEELIIPKEGSEITLKVQDVPNKIINSTNEKNTDSTEKPNSNEQESALENSVSNTDDNTSIDNSTTKNQNEEKSVPMNDANTANTEKSSDIKTTEKPKTEETKIVPKIEAKLCFIVIDSDGTLNYKIVSRAVAKTDSPLTNAINLVLAGPQLNLPTEKNCITLIPEGSKLLSASISNGIATLNFNDAFEFNPDGIEGYIAQLKQIIFTATQFETVKSVQFLIEGKKIEYLGSDGVWIGTPLGRTSF